MCEAQNAVNPNGFTSILTKSQRKMLVSKSDSSLNVLAKDKAVKIGTNDGYITEVGNGNLDFESIIKVADASGVKHICVEQDSWPEDADSLECAKKSFEYIAGILKI